MLTVSVSTSPWPCYLTRFVVNPNVYTLLQFAKAGRFNSENQKSRIITILSSDKADNDWTIHLAPEKSTYKLGHCKFASKATPTNKRELLLVSRSNNCYP